jgi:outer membrane protein
MLRIDAQVEEGCITLKLEGRLAGEGVWALEQAWKQYSDEAASRKIEIYLANIDFVDSRGRELLASLQQNGASLKATGCMNRAVLESIEKKEKFAEAFHLIKTPVIFRFVWVMALLFSLEVISLEGFAAEPLRLNLKEAVQLALKQNPQVQIAAINIAEGQAQVEISRAGLLPKAGIELFDRAMKYNREALFGMKSPLIPKEAGPYQFMQLGGGFEFPIFDLTLWRRWQASKAATDATRGESAAVREKIAVLVVSQYLGCLRADAAVQAAKSRLELATSLHERAKSLQENGVGTSLDTLRAEVQMKAERQRVVSLGTQRQVALFGLERLLDIPQDQSIELTDQLNFFELPSVQVDQAITQAWLNRPEVKTLDARSLALEFRKKGASESRWPKVLASGQWGYQGMSLSSSIPAYQYQVTLQMPLFTGGQIRAERSLADLDLQKTNRERQALKAAVTLEVKTAAEILQSARQEVEIAAESVKLAEEEVRQARDRFEAGIAPNIEVTTAQDNLARTQDSHLGALYQYNQARADLAHACGQVENIYLN